MNIPLVNLRLSTESIDYDCFNYLLSAYTKTLESDNPKIRYKYLKSLRLLIMNLVLASKSNSSFNLPLRKERYNRFYFSKTTKTLVEGDFFKWEISYSHIKGAFDFLNAFGYINFEKGNMNTGVVTRLWPSDSFNKLIKSNLDNIEISSEISSYVSLIKNVKIKKGKYKNKSVEIKKDFFTSIRVEKQNKLLKMYHELSNESNTTYYDRDRGREITLGKHWLTRRFCRGEEALNKGGRFYAKVVNGECYQTINNREKKFRQTIKINGNETVELDYKCIHPSILLNMEGKELRYDPYLVDGYDRGFMKILIMSALFCKDSNSFCSLIRDKRTKTVRKRVENNTLKYFEKLSSMENCGIELIPDYLMPHVFKDKSVDLQFIDSQICYDIIEHFTIKDILVLPVHDSFIIEKKYESELEELMVKKYKEYVSDKFEVRIKGNTK